MTDLATTTDEGAYLTLLLRQAEILDRSSIVPGAYRGKPADIVAAGLAGKAFGWDVMVAMRNYHVIEGAASMRPEAMLGLVRKAGHSVTFQKESDGSGITATGTRADNGDTYAASFTMQDAEAAGLRNKRNWKQYPDAMLTWRAVSKLCRYLFPDVVLGAGLVPEELGATVDSNGEVPSLDAIPRVEPFEILPGDSIPYLDAKKELLTACDMDKDLAREFWADRGEEDVLRAELDGMINGAKAIMEIDAIEAEIVEGGDDANGSYEQAGTVAHHRHGDQRPVLRGCAGGSWDRLRGEQHPAERADSGGSRPDGRQPDRQG